MSTAGAGNVEGQPVPRTTWMRGIRRAEELQGVDLLALYDLGTYMNADGTGARPYVATIAADTGLGESTVRRAITKARRTGWLKRTRRGGRRGDVVIASEYRATLPTATPVAVGDDPNRYTTTPQPLHDDTPTATPVAVTGSPEEEHQGEREGVAHVSGNGSSPTAPGPPRPPEGDSTGPNADLVGRARALRLITTPEHRLDAGELEGVIDVAVTRHGRPVVDRWLTWLKAEPGIRWRYPRDLADAIDDDAELVRQQLAEEAAEEAAHDGPTPGRCPYERFPVHDSPLVLGLSADGMRDVAYPCPGCHPRPLDLYPFWLAEALAEVGPPVPIDPESYELPEEATDATP